MLSFLKGDRLYYLSPRYLRFLAHTVYMTPLIMGGASAYLFAAVPQMQEIYLGIIEEWDFLHGFAGLAALSLFSALLYSWNRMVVTGRIDEIYPDHADIHFDREIIGVRDLKTGFVASLPFLGLSLGLFQVYVHVDEAQKLVTGAGAGLPGASGLQARLPGLATAVIISMLAVAAVYLCLLGLYFYLRRRSHWHRPILFVCYASALVLILIPIFNSNIALLASRFAGPLAGTALVLIEIAVLMRLLFLLIQRAIWILLTLPSAILMSFDWMPNRIRQVLVASVPLAVVLFFGIKAIRTPEKLDVTRTERKVESAKFGEELDSWLKARNADKRYPVFIVAAQGGGIYAASSTAAFLSMMQDHCPAFAKHVFAISGVSGGSVGASLFDAALAETPISDKPGCDSFEETGLLTKRLQAITQDDHMSPVLAYLLPDVIRGFAGPRRPSVCWDEGPVAWLGRDQILEKSFIFSFKKSRPEAPDSDGHVCPKRDDASLLKRPLADTWSFYRNGIVPALVLNATWVETGYRVAASPFALKHFGGGTLYSFDELKGDFQVEAPGPTLIEAAVISARFPVVMPPAALNLNSDSRLTFVDGGYVDSSGTATALQLYNELKTIGGDRVEPYLITLTDKLLSLSDQDAEPIGVASVRGWLYDFFSPLVTLLSVRDLQSRKALKEANTQLAERMIVIKLDQKAFPLPLGWKLSNLSSDVIRFTMGSPVLCTGVTSDDPNSPVFIAGRNSCELKRITGLLAQPEVKPGPGTTSPPPREVKPGPWTTSPQ
jgi:hypothetical protein